MKILLMCLLISGSVLAQSNTSGSAELNTSGFYSLATSDDSDINNIVNTLSMSNSCKSNWAVIKQSQKIPADLPANSNYSADKKYVGVTTEGDIAVISTQEGDVTLTLFVCHREGILQAGNHIIAHPTSLVLLKSQKCAVDQIVANIYVQGQHGQYILNFFPMSHVNNGGLCSEEESVEDEKVSDGDRESQVQKDKTSVNSKKSNSKIIKK
jgi:hypothetical protein